MDHMVFAKAAFAVASAATTHVIIEGLAGVAQSVEQLIRNEKVGCSIHLSGTNP